MQATAFVREVRLADGGAAASVSRRGATGQPHQPFEELLRSRRARGSERADSAGTGGVQSAERDEAAETGAGASVSQSAHSASEKPAGAAHETTSEGRARASTEGGAQSGTAREQQSGAEGEARGAIVALPRGGVALGAVLAAARSASPAGGGTGASASGGEAAGETGSRAGRADAVPGSEGSEAAPRGQAGQAVLGRGGASDGAEGATTREAQVRSDARLEEGEGAASRPKEPPVNAARTLVSEQTDQRFGPSRGREAVESAGQPPRAAATVRGHALHSVMVVAGGSETTGIDGAPASRAERGPGANVDPVQRVVQVLRAQTHSGGGEIRLRLEPPDLGSLRIDMRMHGDVLTLRVQATTDAARQIIESRAAELQHALAQHGISVDRISVEHRPTMGGGAQDAPGSDGGRDGSGTHGAGNDTSGSGSGTGGHASDSGSAWRGSEGSSDAGAEALVIPTAESSVDLWI